ncbi:MAG: lasso peptide biosynthesis PqqD family chaperone [Chloroflexi bacterium]|nr:lasso peptide biosynthesis PqqD family chaperone [Chloroflexota bacterium]
MTISLSSRIAACKNQVSADLDGESVILNLDSGTYYGLNESGAAIWQLLQEPRRVSEIRDTLLAEYDVDAERCEQEVIALLQAMAEAGLVEVQDEAAD